MAKFKSGLKSAIRKAAKEFYDLDVKPIVEHPLQEEHGDYSTNAAMVLAGRLDEKPSSIADKLARSIEGQELSYLESVETALPGFINFRIKEEALLAGVNEINKKAAKYGSSETGRGKTVVIDYSAPNIAKSFGVGHLRSTIIGQALYNLYEALGHRVVGDNHLGDWGTQFGALLAQINNYHLPIDKLTIEKLEELYTDFHREAEDKPELAGEARAWFKRLEDGDKEARDIWKKVIDVSMKEFNRIYELLGVKIDKALGESFYEGKMSEVIKQVKKKELSRKSEGAEIVELDGLPPAILVKSDGATTYFTRDLATLKYRIKTWDPGLVIYEVGADQKLHFQQLFAAAKALGWVEGRELVHVAHGLIRFATGKMSTRRGKTVKLEDVIMEAVKRARKIIDESETGRGLSNKKKKEVARAVGIGALKYFDLLHHPSTDIVFDWEKMFVLEGNSGPYLQYTYARANSILKKAKAKKPVVDSRGAIVGELERPLIKYLYLLPEVIEESAQTFSPNLLCNYLFELAARFNSFYARAPVIKAGDEKTKKLRLALTAATAQVLKNGLTLLGLEAPERL
ncbi:arginine--tRNA ligase [Candidatus Saccharibacteria bacterium]|nr:arginine--tRNA ligase [Candidatus Saccharibacteria bacterium]